MKKFIATVLTVVTMVTGMFATVNADEKSLKNNYDNSYISHDVIVEYVNCDETIIEDDMYRISVVINEVEVNGNYSESISFSFEVNGTELIDGYDEALYNMKSWVRNIKDDDHVVTATMTIEAV